MKQLVRVSKVFLMDVAHALYGYDGPCKNIHGHTYRLTVTVKGYPLDEAYHPKLGMVVDFSQIKKIVFENILAHFDHALVLNKNSPHSTMDELLKSEFEKIIFLEKQPTCENLLLHFNNVLTPLIPDNLQLIYMKLEETPTSYSEWFAEDNG
ncbi:MAG: 6-carboxytetrahydropterin synthase [Bacteroidetes bacterium]|nr:6-carboxytetrahydropterin synthase [Bacteroidota bacterium]